MLHFILMCWTYRIRHLHGIDIIYIQIGSIMILLVTCYYIMSAKSSSDLDTEVETPHEVRGSGFATGHFHYEYKAGNVELIPWHKTHAWSEFITIISYEIFTHIYYCRIVFIPHSVFCQAQFEDPSLYSYVDDSALFLIASWCSCVSTMRM